MARNSETSRGSTEGYFEIVVGSCRELLLRHRKGTSEVSVTFPPLLGSRAPHAAAASGVLFLVATLIVTLFVSAIPKSHAQTGPLSDSSSTFYTIDGNCYTEHTLKVSMDDQGVDNFKEAMDALLAQFGHQASYTFSNGTLTVTATATCPPDTVRSVGKTILYDWSLPAIATVGGLMVMICFAISVDFVYHLITGHEIEAQSDLKTAVFSVAGLFGTFTVNYGVARRWEPALASGIANIFRAAIVSKYNYDGVQTIIRDWLLHGFGLLVGLLVGPCKVLVDTENDLREQALQDLDHMI